jgi:hypothetical protein
LLSVKQMAHIVTTLPAKVNKLSLHVMEVRSCIPVLLKFLPLEMRMDYSKNFSVTVESECNVCIATELCAGPYGVRILVGARDFFSATSRPPLGPSQPSV